MSPQLKTYTRFSRPSNVLTSVTFSLPGPDLRLYKIRCQWPEQSFTHKTRGLSLLVKTLQCFPLAIRPTSRPLATTPMPCRVQPCTSHTPCFLPRLCCALSPGDAGLSISHTGQAPSDRRPFALTVCSARGSSPQSSAWPLRPALRTL